MGERWALPVVRELLLGPLRFSDLRRALPNASSNLITDRLHELEARGVVRRRKLPPPAGSWVYELTEWGQGLEPILLALGDWAVRIPPPAEPRTLSATSAVLFMRGIARPDPGRTKDVVGRLELDERVWTIDVADAHLRARSGEPPHADVTLRTDPETLVDVLQRADSMAAAVADGRADVSGDASLLRQLLRTA